MVAKTLITRPASGPPPSGAPTLHQLLSFSHSPADDPTELTITVGGTGTRSLVAAALNLNDASNLVPTISDSGGNTWSLVHTVAHDSTLRTAHRYWLAGNVAAGATTVALDWGNNSFGMLVVAEFDAAAFSEAQDDLSYVALDPCTHCDPAIGLADKSLVAMISTNNNADFETLTGWTRTSGDAYPRRCAVHATDDAPGNDGTIPIEPTLTARPFMGSAISLTAA